MHTIIFLQLCDNIFGFMIELWDTHFTLMSNLLQHGGDSDTILVHLNQGLLALKGQ